MVALRAADDRAVSDRKREANRLNAQRSTGPRTPAGKAAAARNAVTHGVYCRDLVLPRESESELAALRDGLVADLRPRGEAQAVVVEQILSATWKLRRVRAAERTLYEKFARAEHQRACDAAVEKQNEWENVQLLVTSRKQLHGPPPPPPPLFDPRAVEAGAALAAVVASDEYDQLARLEERLNRQIHRGLRELRLLRKDAAAAAMADDAADPESAAETPAAGEQNEPTADPPADPEPVTIDASVENEATDSLGARAGGPSDAAAGAADVREPVPGGA